MPKIDERFVPTEIPLYVASVAMYADTFSGLTGPEKIVVTFADKVNIAPNAPFYYSNWEMVQSEDATEEGVAIEPYGAIITANVDFSFKPVIKMCGIEYKPESELTLQDYIENIGTQIVFASGENDNDDNGGLG